MRRLSISFFFGLLWLAESSVARPVFHEHQWAEPETELDLVGDVDGTNPAPRKALQDTLWIADWTFDTGAPCDESGWTHVDNHVLNDDAIYWHLETGHSTSTGMAGTSAAVGYHDNVCCEDVDGYDNNWYQGIRMTYTGAATLSFDYIVDSEAGFDFLQIETDSACSSQDRVDFQVDPRSNAAAFRTIEFQTDGLILDGELNDGTPGVPLPLTEYGEGTHCVYVAFFSDGGYSPCDGLQPTSVGEAIVVDNVVLVDASGTRTEDFEDGTLDIGTFVNMADRAPFGTWARLFPHLSDNDVCTENRTCAWFWTDHTTPTLANDPSMAFGPGGFVVKNWLDDIVVSPWVSLASTPTATGTVIGMSRFPGNYFSTGRIVQNWSVRGRGIIQGQPCITVWAHASNWNSLSSFRWQFGLIWDMSYYVDPAAEEIQVRLRVSDWQWIANAGPPGPLIPGPGPYTDRLRIGRRILSGPTINEGIDSRSQAQDAFPTEIDPNVTPAGEHHRPTTDRFGTCAFSMGRTQGRGSPNLITGDSIWVEVQGQRPGGEIVTSVTFNAAIVKGPHVGKAPAPYAVGANGFFSFDADSVRSLIGTVLRNFYCVDFDDTYYRGGDALHYFWAATDDGGGYTSDPLGLTGPPASIAEAQEATQGLLEVSYLPTINWDPAYLARIQADAHGDLEPTSLELANSTQTHCILLYNNLPPTRRLSGNVNRTTFMYALDRLGYRNHYDVYDHQGLGNTNNQLGGRATPEQCEGYSLIVMDAGNRTPGNPILPDGINLDSENVDQAGWFSEWLAQASLGEAGFATLWIVSSNVLEEKSGVSGSAGVLLNNDMGVTLQSDGQSSGINPEVAGVASFTFDHGIGSVSVDFTGDRFVLQGGCPSFRDYDGAAASGATAVVTHRYRSPITSQLGDAAIVMNRSDAEAYNTIMQTHPFFDIRDGGETPSHPPVELALLEKILNAVLPPGCLQSPDLTDVGNEDSLDAPLRTVLYPNAPNPFNPTTTIRFDLARDGHVTLRIYDVAGRLVRTLLDEERHAGRNHSVVWHGLDEKEQRVSSGVYFYRLDTDGVRLTRKLVVMK